MKIQRLLAIAMFFVLALPVGAHSELLVFQTTVNPGTNETVSARVEFDVARYSSGSEVTGLKLANFRLIQSSLYDSSTDTFTNIHTVLSMSVGNLVIKGDDYKWPSCGYLRAIILVETSDGADHGVMDIRADTKCYH